jgi:hypothetical protein
MTNAWKYYESAKELIKKGGEIDGTITIPVDGQPYDLTPKSIVEKLEAVEESGKLDKDSSAALKQARLYIMWHYLQQPEEVPNTDYTDYAYYASATGYIPTWAGLTVADLKRK